MRCTQTGKSRLCFQYYCLLCFVSICTSSCEHAPHHPVFAGLSLPEPPASAAHKHWADGVLDPSPSQLSEFYPEPGLRLGPFPWRPGQAQSCSRGITKPMLHQPAHVLQKQPLSKGTSSWTGTAHGLCHCKWRFQVFSNSTSMKRRVSCHACPLSLFPKRSHFAVSEEASRRLVTRRWEMYLPETR